MVFVCKDQINCAAGDAPCVSLNKPIAGLDSELYLNFSDGFVTLRAKIIFYSFVVSLSL